MKRVPSITPRHILPRKKNPIKHNRVVEILRHPLVSVLLGFFLSAIVGAYITRYYEQINTEHALIKSKQDETKNISKTIAAYIASMQSLADALKTGQPRNIQAKANNYETFRDEWTKNSFLWDLVLTDEFGSQLNQLVFSRLYFEPLQTSITLVDECLRKSLYTKTNQPKLTSCAPPKIIEGTWRFSPEDINDRLKIANDCFHDFEMALYTFAEKSNLSQKKNVLGDLTVMPVQYGCRPPVPGEPDTRGADAKANDDRSETGWEQILGYWHNIIGCLFGPRSIEDTL